MDAWFEITLRLPNILNLSDDEMQQHFSMLDGRWSQQTKNLIMAHGAKGLALNRNWAFVRQWWSCPCCGRYKPSVVRLTPNGILLACLEVHHDHLREWVDRAFDARFGRPRTIPPEAFHVETSARAISERFSEELICTDCNAADGQAKLALGNQIDRDFSFSPQEIKGFIRASVNAPHKIDPEKAFEIWRRRKQDFEGRKSFVSGLIEHVAQGFFRRERTGRELRAADLWLRSGHLLSQAFSEAMSLHPERRWDFATYQNFIVRSTLNDGAGLNAAKRKRKPSEPPSEVEYALLDAAVTKTSTPWRNTPADWECDCCGRSKLQICRKSNTGKWTARIFRYSEYKFETDYFVIDLRRAIYPAFIQDPIISDEIRYNICQDCSSISTQLKSQRPELTDHFYLTIADLRDSITAMAPHRSHERDLSIATDRVIANRPMAEAVGAFIEHRNVASHARSRYRIARDSGFSEGDARTYAALKIESQNGLPEHTLDPFIDWLISEGERLAWRASEPTPSDDR